MHFFQHAGANEFAPFWRLLDDHVSASQRAYACEQDSACTPAKSRSVASTGCKTIKDRASDAGPTFQPRFDVAEFADRYELVGELPGVAQENVEIEFTDPQTLRLTGHSVRADMATRTTAQGHTQAQEQEPQAQVSSEQRSRTGSQHSLRAFVEDEANAMETDKAAGSQAHAQAEAVPDAEADWTSVAGPPTTPAAISKSPTPIAATAATATATAPSPASKRPRYWLSERQVGRFQRTFTFPGDRIDTDRVRAALNNGLLTVTVPKAPAPAKVKISIQ